MIIGTSKISNGAQVRSRGMGGLTALPAIWSAKSRVPLAIAYTPRAGPRKIGPNVAPVVRYVPTPATVTTKAARGHTRRAARPSARRTTAGSTQGEGATVVTIRPGG